MMQVTIVYAHSNDLNTVYLWCSPMLTIHFNHDIPIIISGGHSFCSWILSVPEPVVIIVLIIL